MKKTTRKQEQESINEIVLSNMNSFFEHCAIDNSNWDSVKRLRSCSAKVFTDQKYHVLQSYNTTIAIIDRETDTLYDFLRFAYGYTATSAQHIAKFDHDYGGGKWGCAQRKTWRPV